MKSDRRLIQIIFFRFMSVIIPVGIWQLMSLTFPNHLVPSPTIVVKALINNLVTGLLIIHLFDTVKRVLAGLSLSLLIGTALGLIMGLKQYLNELLDPIMITLAAFPSVAWAVIALIWFGLTESSVIFFIAIICSPVFAIGIREGVRTVDTEFVRMAKSFGHHSISITRSIVMPTIYPYLIAATRYGIGLAWKLTIIAELLGMQSGVGYQLGFNYGIFRIEQVYAWTLSFAAIILLSDTVFLRLVEKHLLNWRADIST